MSKNVGIVFAPYGSYPSLAAVFLDNNVNSVRLLALTRLPLSREWAIFPYFVKFAKRDGSVTWFEYLQVLYGGNV